MGNIAVQPAVVIIILNWNNPDVTLECLRSVMALDYPADCLQVVVVDNGSTDNSVTRLRGAYLDVTLMETGTNLGYAGGNNVGIRYGLERGAEWICILNNDVTVAPDFLTILISVLQEDQDAGVATPLVADMTNPQLVWALGSAVNRRTGAVHRLHTDEQVEEWRRQQPFVVDAASGAAMLVKRQVFEQVGLLDESFFLYYEETDWCLRVHQAGYRVLAVPASVVWHRVSATLGTASPVIDYYMLRNHLHLIARNWHGPQRWRILSRTVICNLVTIAAFTLKTQQGHRLPSRNARLMALRDAIRGHWGKMGPDVAEICNPNR